MSHTDKAAAYPRAKRLSNGEILLGYHHGGGLGEYGTWVTLRHSRDEGATWYATADVEGPEGDRFWGFSNLDFIEVDRGTLLLVTAGRGKAIPNEPEFQSECARSELRLRWSKDFGRTWGEPVGIAAGRGRVWEPSIVQLPSGELEIYFANEAPDLKGPRGLDQRIEVTRSVDGGRTWSEPGEISRHPGCRNGMPAAALLPNGRVACAQEMVRDRFSPWITQTANGRPVEEYIAQKRYGFGAAPFLLSTTRGVLLTFHSGFEKQRAPSTASLTWMFSNVWVQAGSPEAKEFGGGSQPWPQLDENTGAFFPSLLLKDERTLVALASFVTHADDAPARTVVRWREGTLSPEFVATPAPASP